MRRIEEQDVLVTRVNKRGETGENLSPLLLAYQIFFNESLKLAAQFGLTPLSRKKLGIKPGLRKKNRFEIQRDQDELEAL